MIIDSIYNVNNECIPGYQQRSRRKEYMKFSKISQAINALVNADGFDAYFNKLQDRDCACGPTKDEARRDYTAMIRSRFGL